MADGPATSEIEPQDDRNTLAKAATGIQGLDEITTGGFPRGRPTLICGSAGCGKTLLAMEFLVRGATQYNEPGVFMAFEETAEELAQNVRSLGFDLNELAEEKKLALDHVRVERSEIEETGAYDLEGIFVRLGYAIDSIGAKRVVLDTIETLFSGLTNMAILRAELRRLFRWLKDKGVTAVITGERGEGSLTRHGLEEYVSDCVILLDHRVVDQVSTRLLRIVKYRGTTHGTNEYPFLIDEHGFTVMPVTSIGLTHEASDERLSSGIAKLDDMLGGKGYYRGSTILVSGTAGSGKSSVAAHLARATCERGEKCLYFSFEESSAQMLRNMLSIGIDLKPYIDQGLLVFNSTRSTVYGMEMHLATFHKRVRDFQPQVIIVDPVSTLSHGGSEGDATSMVTRLIDYFKVEGITAFLTNLTSGDAALEKTALNISSLVDTWLFLRDVEAGGERNRVMYILKSRGMSHSNQLREFVLTDQGVELLDVYRGPEGVLTGSMRMAQEHRDKASVVATQQEVERMEQDLQRKRDLLDARIAALKMEFEAEQQDTMHLIEQKLAREEGTRQDRDHMAISRQSKSVSKASPEEESHE